MKIVWKKLFIVFVIGCALCSCADNKELIINGKSQTIKPYGWFDLDNKNECVDYDVVVGNVVWSIVLMETIVAPVVISGAYMWEPIRVLEHCR